MNIDEKYPELHLKIRAPLLHSGIVMCGCVPRGTVKSFMKSYEKGNRLTRTVNDYVVRDS